MELKSRIQTEKCLIVREGLSNAPHIERKVRAILKRLDILLNTNAHLSDCACAMDYLAEDLKSLAKETFEVHSVEKNSTNIFILASTLCDGFEKGNIILRGDKGENGVEYFNMTHEIFVDVHHAGISMYNLDPEQLEPASYREIKIVQEYFDR